MTNNMIVTLDDKSAAVSLAHELGMPAEEFTLHGDAIVQAFTRHREVRYLADDAGMPMLAEHRKPTPATPEGDR